MLTFGSPVKRDRDRRMPSHRRVHFQTDLISEVRLYEISPREKVVRSGDITHRTIQPHIPGNTIIRSHDDVSNSGEIHFLSLPVSCFAPVTLDQLS